MNVSVDPITHIAVASFVGRGTTNSMRILNNASLFQAEDVTIRGALAPVSQRYVDVIVRVDIAL